MADSTDKPPDVEMLKGHELSLGHVNGEDASSPQIERASASAPRTIEQVPRTDSYNVEEDDEEEDALSEASDQPASSGAQLPSRPDIPSVFEEASLDQIEAADDAEGDGVGSEGRSAIGAPDVHVASQLLATASQALDSLSQFTTAMVGPGERQTAGHTLDPGEAHPNQQSALPQSPPSPGLDGGTAEHSAAWRQQRHHLLILTTSGKPVYTLHGDSDALAGLTALTSAIVSVVQSQGDRPGHILAGSTLLVFVLRGPFILLAVGRATGDAPDVLHRQLDLLYRQVLLVVTNGLERMLTRNPAYDVRPLLEGMSTTLNTLVGRLHHDASYLLHSLTPVALPPPDQAIILAALAEAIKSSGAYYGALLVAGGGVVAVDRAAHVGRAALPPLDPWDLLALDNFIACTSSIRLQHGEALVPLCLPAYNPAAFLHAYLQFLPSNQSKEADVTTQAGPGDTQQPGDGWRTQGSGRNGAAETEQVEAQDPGLYLALLAPSSDAFHALSRAREALEAQLAASGVMARLQAGLQPQGAAWVAVDRLPPAAGGGKLGTTPLWHFMARFVSHRQVVFAQYSTPYDTPAARQQLAASYGLLLSVVHDYPEGGRPNKLVWLSKEQVVMMAVLDSELELYLALDPLIDKPGALRCADQLRRYLSSRSVQAELLRSPA